MAHILKITQERLKSIVSYNPDTGEFRHRYRQERSPQWNGRYADTIAGCSSHFTCGIYWVMNLDNKTYLAHRLAWLYIYNESPECIDHIDGDGLNNSLKNLRSATLSLNNANSYPTRRGVQRHGRGYKARVKVQGESIYLGTYDTVDEAQAAYNRAALFYFGEYARCARPE